MIAIILNEANFENDIHALVKSFYPGVEVNIYAYDAADKPGTGARTMDKLAEFPHETEILVDFDFENGQTKIVIGDGHNGSTNGSNSTAFDTNFSNKPTAKNEIKRGLYQLLSETTGQELPWGTMTGIRPTSFALDFITDGKSEEEVSAFYKDTFYTSDDKINLAINVAKTEKKLIETIDVKNGYSLYVGIPFCPTTCLYCSFTSYAIGRFKDMVDDYLTAVEKELADVADFYKDRQLDTVYIGGGTPTTLEADQLDRLISFIKNNFDMSNCKEFTVEAGRPDSITKAKFEVLKKHNIDRISINPQTMCQETLDIIGRRHSVLQTLEAYEMARELGFDNINMDLIVGLPNEDEETIAKTLDWMRKVRPDNLTIHSLAIKRAARLNMFKEEYKELAIENTKSVMDMTAKCAEDLGMQPYYLYRQKNMAGNFENVGYAVPGKEGIYNILIMEEVQTIVACGAGASSKLIVGDGRIERYIAPKDVPTYINKIDEIVEKKRELLIGDASCCNTMALS